MTKELSLPILFQEVGSMDCGLICIQMVLAFFGQPKSFDDLKKYIKVTPSGTRMHQLGLYMLQNGYTATMITANPKLFSKQSYQTFLLNPKEYLDTLKFSKKNSKKYFLKYIDIGGNIAYHIPNIEVIKKCIDLCTPIIALMTSNFLYKEKQSFNSHFVVIVGYRDTHVIVHDPVQGKQEILIEEFFFGLHANCYGDHDNGGLLIISK